MAQGRVLAHPLSSDADKRDALQQLLDHGLPAEVPTGQSSWPALLDEVEKASSCPIVGELAARVRRAVKTSSVRVQRARKRRRIDAEAVGDEEGINACQVRAVCNRKPGVLRKAVALAPAQSQIEDLSGGRTVCAQHPSSSKSKMVLEDGPPAPSNRRPMELEPEPSPVLPPRRSTVRSPGNDVKGVYGHGRHGFNAQSRKLIANVVLRLRPLPIKLKKQLDSRLRPVGCVDHTSLAQRLASALLRVPAKTVEDVARGRRRAARRRPSAEPPESAVLAPSQNATAGSHASDGAPVVPCPLQDVVSGEASPQKTTSSAPVGFRNLVRTAVYAATH